MYSNIGQVIGMRYDRLDISIRKVLVANRNLSVKLGMQGANVGVSLYIMYCNVTCTKICSSLVFLSI